MIHLLFCVHRMPNEALFIPKHLTWSPQDVRLPECFVYLPETMCDSESCKCSFQGEIMDENRKLDDGVRVKWIVDGVITQGVLPCCFIHSFTHTERLAQGDFEIVNGGTQFQTSNNNLSITWVLLPSNNPNGFSQDRSSVYCWTDRWGLLPKGQRCGAFVGAGQKDWTEGEIDW